MTKSCACLLVLAAIASSTATVRAQDNSAAVEALFSEGKRLATEGKFAQACPKFLASYNLEHRIGTLLNLADCYEKNNQLASAWARFVEARTLAQRSNQPERADYAGQHASTLLPKLSKLTINVAKTSPGLEVKRDGVAVDAGAYGVDVPIDEGHHVIDASAPGKKSWSGEITVGGNADAKTLAVPELLDAPKSIAGAVDEKPHGLSGRATVGIAITAIGAVALGVGATFGGLALSKNGDSTQYCNVNGQKNDCFAPGVALRQDAVTFGNVSTGLLIGGAVTAAVGLVVWLTAPSRRSVHAAFDGRMFSIAGTF